MRLRQPPRLLLFVQYYFSGRLSQHLLFLASLLGIIGLLASRALVALSPVVGVLAVLANPYLRRDLPAYFRNGAALRAAAMFGFLLLSGFYTSEWVVWRHELFRSLTWLGVPLAFAVAVPLSGRQRLAVGAFFVLATAAAGLGTVGKYSFDPARANEVIRIGQNVEAITHLMHIWFGVLLALSFFWGLLLRRHPLAGPWLRTALTASLIITALTLHVLAYRTGLVVFYAGLVGSIAWLLLRRQVVWGLGLLLLLGAGPWLAYRALPSVRERVAATIYDVEQFQYEHDINNYSLARRLTAVKAATLIIRQHWLLGVAPADSHAAMLSQYSWKNYGLDPENQVDIHNQYLETLLGGGIVGLALWLVVVFWPLTQAWARRNPYVGVFILLQAALMLVANILSLQIGLNLFVFGYGFLVVAGERRNRAISSSEIKPIDYNAEQALSPR